MRWLADFTRDFHQAVRFQLHNVQLRGVEQLSEMKDCEPLEFRGQLIPISEDAAPISRVWTTFKCQQREGFDFKIVDSLMFDHMATFMADHIRQVGSNLRTAWDDLKTSGLKGGRFWHQSGCGLRLSAQWVDDTITICSRVQPV